MNANGTELNCTVCLMRYFIVVCTVHPSVVFITIALSCFPACFGVLSAAAPGEIGAFGAEWHKLER